MEIIVKRANRIPALAECECGERIYLSAFTNECPCGRLYNMGGQRLVPPSMWRGCIGIRLKEIK
jgi:hypothetical protein